MPFILEDLGEKSASDDTKKPKYVFEGVKEPSNARSIAAAPVKGLIKGSSALSRLNPVGLRGPVPEEISQRFMKELLPTKDRFLENALEKSFEAAPAALLNPSQAGLGLLSAASGGIAGAGAKELGAGETGQNIAEILGYLGPDAFNALKGLTKLTKVTPEKLESGLSKIRAVDNTKAKTPFSFITKNRQQNTIEKLNQEAAKLTEKSVEKNVPIAKKINEGFDFEGQFNKRFGEIQDLAKTANPKISTKPLSNFFTEEIEKFHGIPNLHSEGKKIVNEIVKFSKNPRNSLSDLLKIYRSNNKKVKSIYETSQLKGKQKEYADFLVDYNKKIADSIKQTLPEDSKFVKMFEAANKDYKAYKDAQKVEQILKPILGENPTLSSITKLAENQKLQQQLERAMGKEGSQEVIQIAKDLQKSQEAIKKIPVKEFALWNNIFPLSLFIPGFKSLKAPALALKSIKGAKYLNGKLLSSSRGRLAYRDALKAIQRKDIQAYKTSTQKISKLLDSQENEDVD